MRLFLVSKMLGKHRNDYTLYEIPIKFEQTGRSGLFTMSRDPNDRFEIQENDYYIPGLCRKKKSVAYTQKHPS